MSCTEATVDTVEGKRDRSILRGVGVPRPTVPESAAPLFCHCAKGVDHKLQRTQKIDNALREDVDEGKKGQVNFEGVGVPRPTVPGLLRPCFAIVPNGVDHKLQRTQKIDNALREDVDKAVIENI
jgi:hypothetical protein